jgi:hypothetical protein
VAGAGYVKWSVPWFDDFVPSPCFAFSLGLRVRYDPTLYEPLPSDFKKKRVVVLGTGWAAVSFLRHVDRRQFDIVCVSPRNHFTMTPLLPSVAVGTVEARTVVGE